MFLSKIIQYINEQLKTKAFSNNAFANHKLYGITSLVPIRKGDSFLWIPCENKCENGLEYAEIDDRYDIIAYHRINNVVNTTDSKVQFGDSNAIKKQTFDMSMFIWYYPKKICLDAHSVILNIEDNLPDYIKKTELELGLYADVSVKITSANLNPYAALMAEYRTEMISIPPETIFMEVKYQIGTSYKKGCFKNCLC